MLSLTGWHKIVLPTLIFRSRMASLTFASYSKWFVSRTSTDLIMKKLALTIVCALAMNGAAFAQGYINWVLPTTAVTFQTNTEFSPLFGGPFDGGSVVGDTVNVAGSFDYILLTQPYTSSAPMDTNVWDGTWSALIAFGGGELTATNSTGLGGFGKASPTLGSGVNQQVSWANGTTQSVVIVGWSSNLGSSWVDVSNILAQMALGNDGLAEAQVGSQMAFFGETAFGYINPLAGSPGIAITQNNGTPGAFGLGIFSLDTQLYQLPIDIPEPATMALAGLGGLSLLLFHRRK
jgi:hypothetical protein